MATPDPSSPEKPSPAFAWLLTTWLSVPILIAALFLVEEVDFVYDAWRLVTSTANEIRSWLEDTMGAPASLSALNGREFTLVWNGLILVFLLGYCLRRHPRTTAKSLRILFVLVIAGIAADWRATQQEIDLYAAEQREWLRTIYPTEIFHVRELAGQLGRHGTLLFYVWAAAALLAATYAVDWQAVIRLAEQRFDGGRRVRLLQTLTRNAPPPSAALFATLACAGIPIALAMLFMSAPKNLIREGYLRVPFAIGSLPANDAHPVLPLAIQADGAVRLGGSTRTIPSVERLPALREFIEAHQIDSTKMKVTLRIAPESTLQHMISVIDDLKRVGFYVVVFLD